MASAFRMNRFGGAVCIGAVSVLAILIGTAHARAQAVLQFSDGEFAPGDWTLTVVQLNAGGTVDVVRSDSGGNPGAFLAITNRTAPPDPSRRPSVIGVHLNRRAVWSPDDQGPISCLTYQEDARAVSAQGEGQSTGPALVQDGRIYVVRGPLTGSGRSWHRIRFDRLTAANFIEAVDGRGLDDAAHPDFTATGTPLTFGFYRSNSNSISPNTIGIDNWSIAGPCPGDAPQIEPPMVCPRLAGTAPASAIAAALANPTGVSGYGRPCHPNLPPGPLNWPRRWLSLRNLNVPYHPLFNALIFKCGCP